MPWNFDDIKTQLTADQSAVADAKSLEAFRIKYLGRSGLLQKIYDSMKTLPPDQKPLVGKEANVLRQSLESFVNDRKNVLESSTIKPAGFFDPTMPGVAFPVGHQHLLTQTMDEICEIFQQMGFSIHEGPEKETEFNNFTALNIPDNHPSRDGFDTFYLNEPDPSEKGVHCLLRSHTSPGQIRIMQQFQPPLAVVIPGKVYRPDAVDASHSFMFHQIEGLLVDKDVKFSDLKGLVEMFLKKFFGPEIRMRFRPHYFPFTEPSAEVDISWQEGKKDWLEIMGCGMVHPNVFKAVGYPDGKYTGLAFGLGVERIAMLRHRINDIRYFYQNDTRFLEQF